jgi:hypothetical protein
MSIHTCSYYCDRPECIKAQRDELREAIAKREWVSLTIDEIKELYNQWESGNLWEGWNYERALEAKLKEKNSG